jgi:hypothetical protein
MSDALRAEEQGIDEVSVGVGANVQCLAAVEEEGYVLSCSCAEVLELEKLLFEVFQGSALAFLSDKIKT